MARAGPLAFIFARARPAQFNPRAATAPASPPRPSVHVFGGFKLPLAPIGPRGSSLDVHEAALGSQFPAGE